MNFLPRDGRRRRRSRWPAGASPRAGAALRGRACTLGVRPEYVTLADAGAAGARAGDA